MDKRFIEESFPVKEVSVESAKEKNVRFNHPSTLHVWWTRKPLAVSRATNYAALINYPINIKECEKTRKFIIDLCKWENSNNIQLIEKAKKDILKNFGGKAPRILDPYSGGGSIPLEALRIGCDTYANDYNPIAVFIEKCTLEYPQKYGDKLKKDLEKWGNWLNEKLKKDLETLYPPYIEKQKGLLDDSSKKSNLVCYIWTRIVKCQNPNCESEIPLISQYWLVKKSNKKVLLYPYIKDKNIFFKIVGSGYEKIPQNFNPDKGTISSGKIECINCKTVMKSSDMREQFKKGNTTEKIIAAVYYKKGEIGKKYCISTQEDYNIYLKAEKQLLEKIKVLEKELGINPIPDEPTPEGGGTGAERAFAIKSYSMNTWGDLFNSRQKLVLITMIEKIREAYYMMIKQKYDEDYAKAIVSFLAISLDRIADFGSTLCMLNPTGGRGVVHTFGRPILSMVYTYAESNPFNLEGAGLSTATEKNIKWIEYASKIKNYAKISNYSATKLPFEDNFFDAIFTDPPYYDNTPYSYLSDFFYVWLKRAIGFLYPEIFLTPQSPKSDEIVVYTKEKTWDEAKIYFEDRLKKSFSEINRILKKDGIALVVYAHKTTEGWETVINSLLDSGLTVSASWPISTEMTGRLRAQESAALASSIYIVCRKIKKQETGFYPEVKKELHKYLNEKLERLWNEGISGADFFIAAIGAGIEIFGKYIKVIDYEGNEIRANKLLEEIRTIATNFAVKQILHNGFAEEISPLTRFYVLWKFYFKDTRVPYDEANKIAHSLGVNLEREWNKGFIKKEKEFIRVLGPKDRELKELEDSEELIDVLHYVLLLWEKGEKEKLLKKLASSYGDSEAFYRVAQAISSSMPSESKERKLIDGFLSGKERIKESIKTAKTDNKLGKWLK